MATFTAMTDFNIDYRGLIENKSNDLIKNVN